MTWFGYHAKAKDDLRLSMYGGQYGFFARRPQERPGLTLLHCHMHMDIAFMNLVKYA
jgi:hypothetical protein